MHVNKLSILEFYKCEDAFQREEGCVTAVPSLSIVQYKINNTIIVIEYSTVHFEIEITYVRIVNYLCTLRLLHIPLGMRLNIDQYDLHKSSIIESL